MSKASEGKIFFMKYAFPCARVFLEKGKIDEKTYYRLKNFEEIEEELIKKIFPTAFEDINSLAREMKSDVFDIEVQERYWYEGHNKALSKKYKGLEQYLGEQMTLCRIFPAKIKKISSNIGLIEYSEGQRLVNLDFIKEPKENDLVSIHYKYAPERIDDEISIRISKNFS